MKNDLILHYLATEYNKLAYTHNYVYGYTFNGMVYGAVLHDASDLLPYITTLDRASSKNGGTIQLKYKPNKEQLELIKVNADEILEICSEELLENLYKNSKQNRGQIFESLVADKMNGRQSEKKNAKFTDCGDIVVGRTHYQVKYLKATFTDERTLKNLSK
jgi:hypothetical protein